VQCTITRDWEEENSNITIKNGDTLTWLFGFNVWQSEESKTIYTQGCSEPMELVMFDQATIQSVLLTTLAIWGVTLW